MNNKDFIEKCQQCKKEITEIQKGFDRMIEDLHDIEPEKKVRPRYKKYWYVSHQGYIAQTNDFNNDGDNYRYNTGNYFETEKECGECKERLLITQELKDLAMELDTEQIDWSDNNTQSKWYIFYNVKMKATIGMNDCFYNPTQGVIYCTNINFPKEALSRIGEERLNKLWSV